mmetsp:Transcript_8581/g.31700  ORF Transcript_8581/g.31700 Transcript_8581/m.31700 type:complete len:196 (-) Transcript_8581:1974-2561(-)
MGGTRAAWLRWIEAVLVGTSATCCLAGATKICPYCPSNVWHGHCASFEDRTDRWCELATNNYEFICCSEHKDECCEESTGDVVGISFGSVAFLIVVAMLCCFCCKCCCFSYRRRIHRERLLAASQGVNYYAPIPTAAVVGHRPQYVPVASPVYETAQPAEGQVPVQGAAIPTALSVPPNETGSNTAEIPTASAVA